VRPSELLDHKADLMVRLTDPLVKRAMREHMRLDQVHVAPFTPENDDAARATAAAVVENARASLPQAECFLVTEDMSLLVQSAAAGLEGTDRIDRTIVPTRSGLVRFVRPLPIRDIRDQTLLVSWLLWFPVLTMKSRHDQGEPTEAICYLMFNDRLTDPDDVELGTRRLLAGQVPWDPPLERDPETGEWGPEPGWTAEQAAAGVRAGMEHFGRWAFIGSEIMFDGMRMGPPSVPPNEDLRNKLFAEGLEATEYTSSPRYLHALWLLLNQTITQKRPGEIERPARRRAERAQIPARVTVVELRRIRGKESEEPSLVEWSHRWIVRGFWRWQPVSDRHPLAQPNTGQTPSGDWVARIWIAGHVRGPADKPLVVTDKVYRLGR
jgi:hypothetical protein